MLRKLFSGKLWKIKQTQIQGQGNSLKLLHQTKNIWWIGIFSAQWLFIWLLVRNTMLGPVYNCNSVFLLLPQHLFKVSHLCYMSKIAPSTKKINHVYDTLKTYPIKLGLVKQMFPFINAVKNFYPFPFVTISLRLFTMLHFLHHITMNLPWTGWKTN